MNKLLARPKLEDHPFVAGAGGEFIRELAKSNEEFDFKAGHIFFREGGYAEKFYLIVEGKVAVESEMGNGERPVVIQVLQGGDSLGWSWMYPPFTWHFSARACSDGKAIRFNAPALMLKAEENKEFGSELMKRLTRELIQRLQNTRKLMLLNVGDRRRATAEHFKSSGEKPDFPDRVWCCRQNKE
jgi:CRP/FNR family cyclic AMP-dependent transcriptional regulator